MQDGKSQEYKDRKVYDIENSQLKGTVAKPAAVSCACQPVAAPQAEVKVDAKALLFSRVTCPNCRVAEGLLSKANVAYEKLIADDNKELCLKFGVKGAPTLVITDGENHVNYYSVPEIKKYLANI